MNGFASQPAKVVKELGIFIAWQLRHPARTLASKPMLTVIPRSVRPSVRDVRTRRARHCCTPREFHMFEERRIARRQNDRRTRWTDATPLLPSVHRTCGFCPRAGREGRRLYWFIPSSVCPSVLSFFLLSSCPSWQQQWSSPLSLQCT